MSVVMFSNFKGTWNVIKDVIRKKKVISCIPSKLVVYNKEITDTLVIAEKFDVFVDVGPNLAYKISQRNKSHLQYINATTSSLQQTEISEEGLKTG